MTLGSRRQEESREEWLDRNRKGFRHWRDKYPERSLLRSAKKRAQARGTPFNISLEDVVIPDVCPVLGIPIFRGGRQLKDNAPTLDEIIPGKGYVKGNVCVISWRANRLKSDATLEELRKVLRYYEGRVGRLLPRNVTKAR